jgi:hypothetical protein
MSASCQNAVVGNAGKKEGEQKQGEKPEGEGDEARPKLTKGKVRVCRMQGGQDLDHQANLNCWQPTPQ